MQNPVTFLFTHPSSNLLTTQTFLHNLCITLLSSFLTNSSTYNRTLYPHNPPHQPPRAGHHNPLHTPLRLDCHTTRHLLPPLQFPLVRCMALYPCKSSQMPLHVCVVVCSCNEPVCVNFTNYSNSYSCVIYDMIILDYTTVCF